MSEGLPAYTEYKDSGVDWLGNIPAHWEISRIKNEFWNLDNRRIPLSSVERGAMTKHEYDYYGASGIIDRVDNYIFDDELLLIAEDGANLVLRNLPLIIIACGKFWVNNHAHILKVKHGNLNYLAHLMETINYIPWISGAAQPKLTKDRLMSIEITFPPLAEQDSIAYFLKNAERSIQKYIRTKRKLLKLLNEQKQIIIQQAVTRGLNPNAPMKDSGVEWLGEIPTHWEVSRSKYIFREVNNRSSTGKEMHLSMSQKYGLIPSSSSDEWRVLSESYVGAKICEPNDLVLNRLKAHLGVFALASQQGIVSPDYTVFRSIQPINERFFELTLRTPACRMELRQKAKGIVQGFWRLYTDDFYNIVLPIPPLEEQNLIIGYINKQLKEIEFATRRIDQEIDLIREYRTCLIADVVTGKVDVRGLKFEMPEEFDEADLPDIDEDALLEDEEVEDVSDAD